MSTDIVETMAPERATSALYKQTVLMTGITFLAVTGYVLRLEQIYFMAALLGFITLGSYLLSVFALRGLEVTRGPARKIYEGEECDITLTVSNRSRLPKMFLTIRDALPQWAEPVGESQLMVATLFPRRSVQLTYRVRATKRGAFQLGPVTVSATDPLGAFSGRRSFGLSQELIVFPMPVRVSPEPLAGAAAFGGVETEQLSVVGAGLEFYGIRDYRPGDALRRIHWPSTARLGHFHVLEFEESFGSDMVVVVDLRAGAHAGSGKDSSLEVAIKAAASLAAHAVDSGSSVTVAGQDRRGYGGASARRGNELPVVLEALARMEADGEEGVASAMGRALPDAAGSTGVLLTAAPDEEIEEAVRGWTRRQAQVVVVLLDAHSFDASVADDVYGWQRRLEATGARVEVVRRGDELEGVLGRAVKDVS